MTSTELLVVIEEYNLSIRRIPEKVVSLYHPRHHKEGNELVTIDGKEYSKETRIPEHAGWYMVKSIQDTGSIIRWNYSDNLAPTLHASIELYLKKLKSENCMCVKPKYPFSWERGKEYPKCIYCGKPIIKEKSNG